MRVIKKTIFLLLIVAIAIGSYFYFSKKIDLSNGDVRSKVQFEVSRGENALEVGRRLEESGLIANKFYFAYYLWSIGKLHGIIASQYKIEPGLTTAEIARMFTMKQAPISENNVKITFPEGWGSEQMALRLGENGLPADAFLQIIKRAPDELLARYDFLGGLEENASLEGYLFPDTYFFAKDASAEDIVVKMLDNFSAKVTPAMRQEVIDSGKSVQEIVTMASIIQKEVVSNGDMKLVSGIFWNRIANRQALQSCATLAFILGQTKKQYSIADTKVDSPYNTYENRGLTPGPICNPGIDAINAAMHPENTSFNYFLSDPATGKTVFSKTFEEHVANKEKYGL